MKKAFLGIGFISIFLFACKEQIPSGLVLTQLASNDTTYITPTLETPQAKMVVIEELTGARCTNCPKGTKILNQFVEDNPGRVIVTALHSGFLTTPPDGALYDFRNADADALRLFFNEGDPAKPGATFDRVKATTGNSAGFYFVSKGQTGSDWLDMLPTRLSKTTPVNIHLTSQYSSGDNKAEIKVKIAFTADVTEKLGLTLYVLENGKKDIQEDTDLGEIPDYEFNHILRKIITPTSGELILDSLNTKVAGRVLEKTLTFTPTLSGISAVNPDSCVVVGIIHKSGSSKEILHAAEVHLK